MPCAAAVHSGSWPGRDAGPAQPGGEEGFFLIFFSSLRQDLEVQTRLLCKYSRHIQTSTQKCEQTQIKVLSVPRPWTEESTGEM